MKKIFIILLTFSVFLFGQNLEKLYSQKTKSLWVSNYKGSVGSAKIKFIFDKNSGKLSAFFILERKGNEAFIKHLKDYIKEVKKLELSKEESSSPFVEFIVKVEERNAIPLSNKISIFKKEGNNVYGQYLAYLIKVKKMSKDKIKKIIHSNSDNFYKNFLYAIYFDYTKNDLKTAETYYKNIYKKYLYEIKGNFEGLIFSDYLIRTRQFEKIPSILPDRICLNFVNRKREICYYYQTIGFYFTGKDYEIPLSHAKAYFPEKIKLIIKKKNSSNKNTL